MRRCVQARRQMMFILSRTGSVTTSYISQALLSGLWSRNHVGILSLLAWCFRMSWPATLVPVTFVLSIEKSQPRPTTRRWTTTSSRAWSATVCPSSPSPGARWSTRRGSWRCRKDTADSSTENPSPSSYTRGFSRGTRSVQPSRRSIHLQGGEKIYIISSDIKVKQQISFRVY